jgi:succinate-semialdehyde dehydrogenase/glutarate-semialdehyde dehydrogenase
MSVETAARPILEVRNPATGETAGEVRLAAAGDVALAVERARRAQPAWEARGFGARARVIGRFVGLLRARQPRILDTLQNESGKVRRDALSEVLTVVRTAQYYAAHGASFLAGARGGGALPGLAARTVHKPHGAVGFVTPWNYPLLLSVGDAIPALLAGNTVVIKPSELTPLSAELAVELLREAGLPEDAAHLVHGDGEVGAELVRRADCISFTGSNAVGRKVAAVAGERLVPCSLELGGKNPMIVLAGAPIAEAAAGFVAGAFFNSGQTCIAVERAFVERPVYDEFVERAVELARGLRLGWSTDWDLDMGCLISARHAEKVMGHIDDARERGAEVLTGGRRRSDLGPAFVEPTLLANVDRSARAYAEETFGPVVSVYPVDDAEEAVARANDTPYGLNASVWGGDGSTALGIARRLETGSAVVNASLMIYHCFGVPMGGVKQSGLGRRHGAIGIQRFTQVQSLVSSPATGGGYDAILTAVESPRAAAWLTRLFHLRGRLPGLR